MKRWSKEEINFLLKNYETKMNKELRLTLNRSHKAILFMAGKLGLKKNEITLSRAKKRTSIEISRDMLWRFYKEESKSIREIAKKVGLSKNTISYYLKKWKILRRTRAEASKLGSKKFGIWKKGLTKENDLRIFLATEKMKKTCAKKRARKYGEIEKKMGKPLKDIINELYWDKKLNQEEIAEKLGIMRKIVIDLMKKFDISKRPNFQIISSLKGKNHSQYGKKWEDIYGKEGSIKLRKEFSLRSRKMIIKRLENNEMPFINTKIEKLIADEMRKRGFIFIAQFPVDDKFVCDFAIPKNKIIIECDGDYWHANPAIYDLTILDARQKRNNQRDKFKDEYLKERGWRVLRFFESDILRDVGKCVDTIENFLKSEQIKKVQNPLDIL